MVGGDRVNGAVRYAGEQGERVGAGRERGVDATRSVVG